MIRIEVYLGHPEVQVFHRCQLVQVLPFLLSLQVAQIDQLGQMVQPVQAHHVVLMVPAVLVHLEDLLLPSDQLGRVHPVLLVGLLDLVVLEVQTVLVVPVLLADQLGQVDHLVQTHQVVRMDLPLLFVRLIPVLHVVRLVLVDLVLLSDLVVRGYQVDLRKEIIYYNIVMHIIFRTFY